MNHFPATWWALEKVDLYIILAVLGSIPLDVQRNPVQLRTLQPIPLTSRGGIGTWPQTWLYPGSVLLSWYKRLLTPPLHYHRSWVVHTKHLQSMLRFPSQNLMKEQSQGDSDSLPHKTDMQTTHHVEIMWLNLLQNSVLQVSICTVTLR